MESSSLFAQVIQDHLELKERNSELEAERPLDRYKTEDPFENHPLFKTEEQARLEETMDGDEPAAPTEAPHTEAWPAFGAGISYFFDPDNGRRRRKVAADRLAAVLRRHGGRLVRGTVSEAHALKQKTTHLREEPKPQPDDVTLARKVESEIFREADVPKGKINVNAENGKIVLRGEVDSPELIDELVGKARKVQGVQDVESLLHTSAQS